MNPDALFDAWWAEMRMEASFQVMTAGLSSNQRKACRELAKVAFCGGGKAAVADLMRANGIGP